MTYRRLGNAEVWLRITGRKWAKAMVQVCGKLAFLYLATRMVLLAIEHGSLR